MVEKKSKTRAKRIHETAKPLSLQISTVQPYKLFNPNTMRKISTIFLLLLFSLTVNAQSTPELLYYNFNGSGTTVPNLASMPPSGTNTATIMGGVTLGGSAICDGSLIGSGASSTTDYLNTGWATSLDTSAWTIAWRTSGISTNATLYYVFGDIGANNFRCFTNGIAGSTNWVIRGGGLTDVYINGGALSTPTFMAYVYDPTLANVKAYLNGVLVSTVAQGAVNITGPGPFKVMGYNTNVGAPLGGFLDEFRVYNRALSDAEILELYNPTVTGFLGTDQMLCAGDSIELVSLANSSTWSTGDTSNTIWVDSVSSYTVSFSGLCGSGTDTITITQAPALTSPGFAGADFAICTGDTLPLTFLTNDPILWSTGDTTDTTWVTSPGSYTVQVQEFCGVAIDTVEVTASALVYTGFILADSLANLACDGDTVMLWANSTYDSYLWSTGDTTQAIWVSSAGTYSLNVADSCGMGSDSIAVSFIAPVNAAFSFSLAGAVATFTDASTGSGTLVYAWDFGDGNTSTLPNPSHTYAASGSYTVSFTVSNECGSMTVTDTAVVNLVGLANAKALGVKVYPNPAKDRVTISAALDEAQDLRITVVSVVGQLLASFEYKSVNGDFQQTLDLTKLASGIYLLNVESVNGKHVTRLEVE
jgi:hypothetical protein